MLFRADDLVIKSALFASNRIGPLDFAIHRRRRLLVIGPSGCGKSTLLNMITGINNEETVVSGRMESGRRADEKLRYIPQQTIFLNRAIPVRQLLQYHRSMAGSTDEHVASLLAQFGLAGCDGRMLSELSGGETRRVATLVELLYRPSVLVLDQPLTGLDAFRANEYLTYLAGCECKTIVFVGHQLNDNVLNFFDDLLVMNGRGETTYACSIATLRETLAGADDAVKHNLLDTLIHSVSALPLQGNEPDEPCELSRSLSRLSTLSKSSLDLLRNRADGGGGSSRRGPLPVPLRSSARRTALFLLFDL